MPCSRECQLHAKLFVCVIFLTIAFIVFSCFVRLVTRGFCDIKHSPFVQCEHFIHHKW